MIFGITHHDRNRHVNKEAFLDLVPARLAGKAVSSFINQNIALGTSEMNVPTIDDGVGLAFSGDKKIVVAASGNIFAAGEDSPFDSAQGEAGAFHGERSRTMSAPVAQTILRAYQSAGENGFKNLNGQFAAAIWDSAQNKFLLVRDHLGFEPLFYYWDGQTLIFNSFLKDLIRHENVRRDFNHRAIRNYLLFNYNPGLDTFIQNVKKVRPGHVVVLEKGRIAEKRYWRLSYANIPNTPPGPPSRGGIEVGSKGGMMVASKGDIPPSPPSKGGSIEDYKAELLRLTRDAIRIRTQETASDPGAFLSGGMDSSSVVGLLSGLTERPIHTFSFRCEGKYVDESYYARVMADHYKTRHNEIPFTADELMNFEKMAEWMDEPLCDIGVELGSFIMGRAAQGQVQYILTGDGGDELYAGHPVYLADQMAAAFDKIPAPLRVGILGIAGLLPDSDKKKSLLVKARRFAYSYNFPAELLSNRWRIYYTGAELAQLCNPEVVRQFGDLDSYRDITDLYADADGSDHLSRALYGDYQTLVHFHVDRLRLTRAWGIEARFPLHDYRLVEFSATIPSALKIRNGQVKYIQHEALAGVLPDEIVFRKNKMGHNVPMKNWMRETTVFRDLMNDVLSETAVKRRGIFNASFVKQMLDLHLRKKKDYSHRLYALVILELWLKKNLDRC
jgi:asparagine synthase (glutamine-hydrolysing)